MSDNRILPEYGMESTFMHLSSIVGHYLINSFSAIVSNSEVIRMAAGSSHPEDHAHFADLIVRASIEASGVARKMIDLSGQFTRPGTQLQDLNEIVRQAIVIFKRDLPREVEVISQLEPLPAIPGWEHDLRGMFLSLLTNAFEALPNAQGIIELTSKIDDRGWISIAIRDSGVGMDPSIQKRALDPFFTTKPEHLGIGLSVAYSIWRRHRGSLSLKSEPGRGTSAQLIMQPYRSDNRPAWISNPTSRPTGGVNTIDPPPSSRNA